MKTTQDTLVTKNMRIAVQINHTIIKEICIPSVDYKNDMIRNAITVVQRSR